MLLLAALMMVTLSHYTILAEPDPTTINRELNLSTGADFWYTTVGGRDLVIDVAIKGFNRIDSPQVEPIRILQLSLLTLPNHL